MKTKFCLASHALIFDKFGRLLVTRRSKDNDYMPGKWDTPGGTIEPGETPEQALIREVKEETGLDVTYYKLEHIYTNFQTMPERQYLLILYKCECNKGEVIVDEEHDAYLWVHLEELGNLDLIHFVKEIYDMYNGGGI